MSKFIPEIYKRLGTTVTLDLGIQAALSALHDEVKDATTEITASRQQVIDRVDMLASGVTNRFDQQKAGTEALLARAGTIDGTTAQLLVEMRLEAGRAEQRQKELEALIVEQGGGGTDIEVHTELTESSRLRIEPIVALQQAVLAGAPADQVLGLVNAAMHALDGEPELQTELSAAYGHYKPESLHERSAFFWCLHELAEDVADCWDVDDPQLAKAHAAQRRAGKQQRKAAATTP